MGSFRITREMWLAAAGLVGFWVTMLVLAETEIVTSGILFELCLVMTVAVALGLGIGAFGAYVQMRDRELPGSRKDVERSVQEKANARPIFPAEEGPRQDDGPNGGKP
jgi:hypothetical protein